MLPLLLIATLSVASARYMPAWPCTDVTPLPKLDLDSMVGKWYSVELMGTAQPEWDCVEFSYREIGSLEPQVVNFVVTGDFVFNEGTRTQDWVFTIDTNESNSTWSEMVTRGERRFVDLTADGQYATYAMCEQFSHTLMTIVLGRSGSVDNSTLSEIHGRLHAVGVRDTDDGIRVDNSHCNVV